MEKDVFKDLNTIAAISLRDAVEAAIAKQEESIKLKPIDGLRPDVAKHLDQQHMKRVEAIAQLIKVRKAIHGRVFDSIGEE